MGMIWVLQDTELAIAAGRFKSDCHYIGQCSAAQRMQMEQSHAFTKEWADGSTPTPKQLQRLRHLLFKGAILAASTTLPSQTLYEAFGYAKALGTVTVLFDTGEPVDTTLLPLCDYLVGPRKHTGPAVHIALPASCSHPQVTGGAVLLSLMNGLNPAEKLPSLLKKASTFAEAPWYDELAY